MEDNLNFIKTITLVGNPNVGKSTVFNSLTGLKQHTGNWAGKTVDKSTGEFNYKNQKFNLVDTPGTYSLFANSKDEQVARDFICFGHFDLVVIVCDATCIERNLNLVLQITEVTPNVLVCINLIDEARSKGIEINTEKLRDILDFPIILTSATKGEGLEDLKSQIFNYSSKKTNNIIKYKDKIEDLIDVIYNDVDEFVEGKISTRWVCLQLIQNNNSVIKSLEKYLEKEVPDNLKIKVKNEVLKLDFNITDFITSNIIYKAEEIADSVITYKNKDYKERDFKIDKIITNKLTGIPIMILLLSFIFWLTIFASSYPSEILSTLFFVLKDKIVLFFEYIKMPYYLQSFLIDGVYSVLVWVISVMLPSMAIFFPLFTILEDLGYLSRVAFNLDKVFEKSNTCGKQALTMSMGFGCNCVGVTSCRIIDSERERLIAILTNNFVPCNGRFPILISVISMFFLGVSGLIFKSLLSAIFLTFVIAFAIFMTLIISKILSKTILKGLPSNFTLELPPYRKPQIFRVIYNSIFDRILFVLGRAIISSIPAGIIIWFMSNISYNDLSILKHCTIFLEPFANLIGLDGTILMAFLLGFPANEIVIPIMIMIYINSNTLVEYDNILMLKTLFLENGWTINTAICTIIFTLFHFPCATACLTIKKETGSFKWTALAFILPTLIGIFICFVVTCFFRIFI